MVWGTNWYWQDVAEFIGELKDVFLSLPEEEKEALMDNYGYSIARDIEAGIMGD